jgi:Tol biopolymer transport system component
VLANRLDSWKEIAVYLGRGVRTVQRWEREEGLPVHRLAHEKRGTVYADRDEVDAWWQSRRLTLASVEPTAPSETSQAHESRVPPQPVRVTSSSAATFCPAISSDGRMFAFVSDGGQDGTTPQIWLKQLGGAAIRLTSARREYNDLSFSDSDTKLIFTAKDDAGQGVYEMPTLGGEPRLLKRMARGGRVSPDGKWLAYVSLEAPSGLRIASLDGAGDRPAATGLTDVASTVWSPDGTHVLVRAHPDSTFEPDYWIVALDTGLVTNTGVVRKLHEQGFWLIPSSPAWVHDSLVFSALAAGRQGVNLWRQRLDPATLLPTGDAEPLTRGTEMDWFPTGVNGRIAYVTIHTDQNLWSVAIDATTGMSRGPVRRLTRGPGVVGHLSVTDDGRTLAYFAARIRVAEILIRSLETDAECAFADDAARVDKGFPAISPSGSQLAYSVRVPSARAMRPVFVATLPDGTSRLLCDDCGGRPRHWLDERTLLIETFGSRLNTLALIDTTTGERRELLASGERSVTNPRVSPDGRWIAFDATRPAGSPNVYVAALDGSAPIAESAWEVVDSSASHPFWSADGSLLYYLPTTPSAELRGVVRARRLDLAAGRPVGDAFTAFTSNELIVPTMITGAAPVATADRIIFVLGDFRGDVWMMDLEGADRH